MEYKVGLGKKDYLVKIVRTLIEKTCQRA